jgi:electron transfer flavoprotein beta subunit
MNIIVCMKQTFDTEAKISLTESGKIADNGVAQVINPYDEFAIEEGLKLKEKFGGEVTIVSVGGEKVQESIRTALAMGADKAILVNDPDLEGADEWVVAEVLAKAISQIPHDVILAGRIAVDDQSAQVAVRVAEAMGLPSVSSIVAMDAQEDKAVVTREIDGGTEVIQVPLPAVFTAQKGLNEPRYPSMMGIMKAKNKELKVMTLVDLGISENLTRKSSEPVYSLPSARKAGVKIQGEPIDCVRELVRLLNQEAKVL